MAAESQTSNRSREGQQLVVLRHGSSVSNESQRFGGWEDVELSDRGVRQAKEAGRILRDTGVRFDIAFCSALVRAFATLQHCLYEMGLATLPTVIDWRLNERHYGALQGMSKPDAERLFGAEQVLRWRRDFRERPPLLMPEDPRNSRMNPIYAGLQPHQIPLGESLRDAYARVKECWATCIEPELRRGQTVLIVAHGNSIRLLQMLIEGISEHSMKEIDIPHAVPMTYRFCRETSSLHRTAA
jgi:2,3-bisphosphoglycerate-dependent phosphoglycerate mutase